MHSKIGRSIANYTAREQALIDLLPKDGSPVTSSSLVKQYYGDEIPINGPKIVIDRLRQIMKKTEYYDDDFRIKKSPRAGPNPLSFHIERVRETA